jgi:bifunctional non-homologous end joining protein LigD
LARPSQVWHIDGRALPVSHLDKLYWDEAGYTKGAMLEYYRQIALAMLPHLHERPITLRLFPEGAEGGSYYQRALPKRAPAWMRSADYEPESALHIVQLPLVDDAASLLWLANAGSIEFHVWANRVPDLAAPDVAIFDLDPGDELTFADVVRGALFLRQTLQESGVSGFPKTSGGHGLHVFVPLAPGPTVEEVRAWVRQVSAALAEAHPELFAPVHGAGSTHEGARITIDAAQNGHGRNTAAPYTLRGRHPRPMVSTPLRWEEIEEGGLQPDAFGPEAVLERVRRLGDVFAPVLSSPQAIPSLPRRTDGLQ